MFDFLKSKDEKKDSKKVTKLEDRIEKLEKQRDDLEDNKIGLKSEVEGLKSKKKIEEEQIKHLVKLKDEKRDIEIQKKELTMQAEKATAIAEVKDSYQDKLTEQLQSQISDNNERYAQILKRLPDVNVRLKGEV